MNLLVASFVPWLAVALLAQDRAEPDTYLLQNGNYLVADVLAVEGDRVVLRMQLDHGSVRVTRRLAEFDAHSAYRMLETTLDPKSAEARLRLAEFAVEHGLAGVAQRDLDRARALSGQAGLAPELAKRIEAAGAALLVDRLQKELAGSSPRESRRTLAELLARYPASAAALRKDELFARIEQQELRLAEQKRLADEKRLATRRDAERAQVLAPIEKQLTTALAERRQGLLDSRHLAAASACLASAIDRLHDVQDRVARAAREHPGDATLADRLVQLESKAGALLTDSLLDLGSMCIVRGQFGQALGHANAILADDPGNPAARALRSRIEIAANASGYGYGYWPVQPRAW